MENNNNTQPAEPTSKELIASVIPEDGGVDMPEKKNKSNGGRLVFEFNKNTLKYIAGLAALIILFAWIINNTDKVSGVFSLISSVISPFVTGFCFAFVINVLLRPTEKIFDKIFGKCDEKKRAKIRRPVCLVLSTVIIIGLLFALVFMIIPEFINALQSLIKSVPQYVAQVEIWAHKLIAFAESHGVTLPELSFNSGKILDTLKNFINSSGIVDKTIDFTGSIVTGIVNLIIAIAFSLYLLAQKERLSAQIKKFLQAFLPKKNSVDRLANLVEIADRTFTSFITGQLTEAVIIGVLCFIGMLIFKMPYAAVISVLVGFTALIPVFGAFIGTALGALLIVFDNPMKALWFVVFIVVLQQLEGNLIYPKVVGKSVGLPGIWVLVAVSIGGTAFGIPGILLSVPLCSVVYNLTAYLVKVRLKKKEELETESAKKPEKKHKK
ncbi:MAG: AI-2E family transporter [Ruminococcaceae bacterium]|nr:AI-2E family transporter [Oscillospiraceae bacterium]